MGDTDIASTIKFRDICRMFERVKKAPLPRKEVILRRYYDSFCKHREMFREQNGIPSSQKENGKSSFYSVLRLFLPRSDTVREPYGLQISALGRLYTRVLQLPTNSRDAIRLQWRSASSIRGDFADVVYSVLIPRCHRQSCDINLKQLHEILDTIAMQDTKSKECELIKFSEMASAEEQKWLIRILLKNLNLCMGEQRIFSVLHPAAQDLYQRCTNLERVCRLLADNNLMLYTNISGNVGGNVRDQLAANMLIEPFQQIRPMLCERFPGKVEELMKSDVLYVETKMDGERFQLHFANGCFKYFSRNGADYTFSFGSNFDEGNLTPQLKNLLPIGLKSIIIDGEMMVWDSDQKRFRDKGENTDVKHLDPQRSWQPCFIAYDLLYINGNSLMNMTYVERTYKLQELVKEKPGVLEIMKAKKIRSLEEFNTLFQKHLDSNAEGIVIKKQSSIYKPGVRIGGGWYKDKADYIKGLTTEFDVLIVGGFYNRKRTFIKSFLLGVLKQSESGQQHDEVYSFGKVSNNTRERAILNNFLTPNWHDITTEHPPLWYHYMSGSSDGQPDVWIEPQKSTILQIKAADLAPSSSFATSNSLHFPRIEAWRNDKVWNECITLQELIQLIEGKVGVKKINKRQLRFDDFTYERKRMKMTEAQKRNIGILSYEKRFDNKKISAISSLFDGFSFCILSGAPRRRYTKHDLQNLAARNGGTIVENPLPNNPKCICVAGTMTYYVERLKLMKPPTSDIVCMDWLLRVCKNQQIHLRPKDMMSMTEGLTQQFVYIFDRFGDSYMNCITSVDEMKEVLADISDVDLHGNKVGDYEIANMENLLFGEGEERTQNFFDNLFVYFYEIKTPLGQLDKIKFHHSGGQCVENFQDLNTLADLSHIVVDLNNFDVNRFKKWLHQVFGTRASSVLVVNIDWIASSYQYKRRLNIHEYLWHG